MVETEGLELGDVMLLEGSCHCQAVRFRVRSDTFYPYQACYCYVCRKTAGGGGYAINLRADAGTPEVEGAENLSVYEATSRAAGRRSGTSAGAAAAFSGSST